MKASRDRRVGAWERLKYVSGLLRAVAGPPLARAPAAPPPKTRAPIGWALGPGLRLWRLPVGFVRVRQWHRALPAALADLPDDLRFPAMMSDPRLTEWLDCVAWLIEHRERRILVDTGESADFGAAAYFGAASGARRRIYTRILDAAVPPEQDFETALSATGVPLADIDLCVLTHTHSDHVGNVARLDRRSRLLVCERELTPSARSGRLLEKLPRDGRVTSPVFDAEIAALGPASRLTERGDIFVAPTPGHTIGHQSVLIDLGDRQALIAGDAAFDDAQVAGGIIPGIVEDARETLQTYERLRKLASVKPTILLFTHDANTIATLDAFAPRVAGPLTR